MENAFSNKEAAASVRYNIEVPMDSFLSMRRSSLPGAALIAIVLTVVSGMAGISSALALEAGSLSVAPLNPAFVRYQQSLQPQTRDGVTVMKTLSATTAAGYVPSPVDRSYLKGQSAASGITPLALDGQYDLRDVGGINRVTPVRDQQQGTPCDTAWTFAALGSLESVLMPAEVWDFSENHLKNTHGFDFGHCDGGNGDMATAYFARWAGPLREVDDPYNPASDVSPSGILPQKHVQEALLIPQRIDTLDNDVIKQAIVDYGGVMAGYYSVPESYTPQCSNPLTPGDCAYYYDVPEGLSNHVVTLIGWNDIYESPDFPGILGAFIAKNSLGTSWGDDGYFYILYEDVNLGMIDPSYVFNNAGPVSNYYGIYEYDPLGLTDKASILDADLNPLPTVWFANIFTAYSHESLAAVSFYTQGFEEAYEIYVYKGVTSGPVAGQPVSTISGLMASPGYHTVAIPPVELVSGDRFSVVVKLTETRYLETGFTDLIPLETPVPSYSMGAVAGAGQSFVSGDGLAWSDTTIVRDPNSNVCVKAFTGHLPGARFTESTLSGTLPLLVQFTDTSDNGATSWLWDFGDGTTSTERNPSHIYRTSGSFNVTLTAGGDTMVKGMTINSCPNVPDGQIRNSGGSQPNLEIAYQTAAPTDTIEMIGMILSGGGPDGAFFTTPGNKVITLKGGLNCDYSPGPVFTVLSGSLQVFEGTITVEGIEIR